MSASSGRAPIVRGVALALAWLIFPAAGFVLHDAVPRLVGVAIYLGLLWAFVAGLQAALRRWD